jgi:peroxiredoxin
MNLAVFKNYWNKIYHTGDIMVLLIASLLSIIPLSAQTIQKEIPADYGYIVKLGQTLPDFELILPDGKTTTTKALRGKVVMLQFTASWCGVCRKEMPHIEAEIWQKHKNNPDFALFGIDLKEEKEKVVEFQKQIGITYPLALDLDGKIFYTFAAPDAGVTRNVIVDKEGQIVFMTRLYKDVEFNEMKKVIETLLAPPNLPQGEE